MNEMNDKPQEEGLVEQARKTLDQSCDRLDGQTLSRLNSIRHAALEQGARKTTWPMLAPFGGLVTACVLVLVISMNYSGTPGQPAQSGSGMAIEDLDILTSAESLEFYENLEFYQWLEENEASV